ncbi:helix-turn-helix domain-containing protein [Latilactobacillus curvatus]|nr:helix-turn-helix transcriptional regulator [Latilactobacillus curvatus]MDG2978126.1 helix-turn-helix domain-containing protein [Latilactobacillus curvatus]
MSVGNALKEARMNVGVTQEQVAQNLFVTRQTVSRWEQDKTLPNVGSYVKNPDIKVRTNLTFNLNYLI